MTDTKKKDDPLAPVDARPLIEAVMKLGERSNKVERDAFKKALTGAFDSTGNIALERAFKDGIVTEDEWMHWRDDWNVELGSMAPLLQGYFNKKDGYLEDEEKVIIVTMPRTSFYKHRRFFEKKFDITICDPKEALERMADDEDFKKEHPDEVKEIKELLKKEEVEKVKGEK